ncbi:hypothetical protein NP493_973g00030 [Ridgeia piscesae]|uniref:Testis expressed 9 n=1 Tax=Ridgeia piscesae TaxID=27915 RepID=A0AAD9KJ14_RIDPI|nr:hypothetical protein NP493_973g00030 [Ridgeia piscesae]
MADKAANVRPHSSQRSKTKSVNMVKPADSLQSREAEYQRLNDELEAKTAKLVSEAEEMLKLDFDAVQKSSLLDNVQTDSSLEEDSAHRETGQSKCARSSTRSTPLPQSGRHATAGDRKPNSSRLSSRNKTKLTRNGTVSDVALVTEEKMAIRDFSLEKTISTLEGKIAREGMESHAAVDMADIIPATACEMGTEAQIRFLKAKLRVMQEELTRVSQDSFQKEQEQLAMKSNMKRLEEENSRHLKTINSLKVQMKKHERMSGESRNKTVDLETELSQLKKEMNTISQTHQKAASTKSITEVRLNRAIEEVEKYKKEVSSYKASLQDASLIGEKRVEYLTSENKRLENQKKELMVAFKKQMKLIDLYKRQRLHVEAAKMLSFAEEEFLCALEWGK